MIIGSRVKLLENFSFGEKELKIGSFCTIVSFVDESIAIVRYGYSESSSEEFFCGVPISYLEQLSQSDINNLEGDLSFLCHKTMHIGNSFKLINGSKIKESEIEGVVGKIIGFQISQNEQEDKIKLSFEGVVKNYTKRFLENNFYHYNEKFESQLSPSEFNFSTKSENQNWALPGKRILSQGKVYFILEEVGDQFIVEDLFGKQVKLTKESLSQLSQQKIKSFKSEEVVSSWLLPGKKVIAKAQVCFNGEPSLTVDESEVCLIKEIISLEENVFEDLFLLQASCGQLQLRHWEIKTHFRQPSGIFKKVNGKILESVKDQSKWAEKNSKTQKESTKKDGFSISEAHPKKRKILLRKERCSILSQKDIIINDITIGQFRFKLQEEEFSIQSLSRQSLSHQSHLEISQIEQLIFSLQKLQKIIELKK